MSWENPDFPSPKFNFPCLKSNFFTRKLIFLNGFMSFLNGFLRFFNGFPTFTFGFLLSAMPFYFPQRFAAFCKGFLIFLKGFPISLDGFPLSEKSKKIYLRRQVHKRLLFELRNSSPLCSLSFVIATRSLAMTSNCYTLWSMEYLTVKRKQVITNNEHKKIIHKLNDSQINYLRRTALNTSSSAYSNICSNEYATSKNQQA